MPDPDARYLHIPVVNGELRFDLGTVITPSPPGYVLTPAGEWALEQAERLADPQADAAEEAHVLAMAQRVREAVQRRQAEQKRRDEDARIQRRARNARGLQTARGS